MPVSLSKIQIREQSFSRSFDNRIVTKRYPKKKPRHIIDFTIVIVITVFERRKHSDWLPEKRPSSTQRHRRRPHVRSKVQATLVPFAVIFTRRIQVIIAISVIYEKRPVRAA